MPFSGFRLRSLSLPLRAAATCLVLALAGGYAASFFQLVHHYQNKDEDPTLTMDDLLGSFHGLDRPARLLLAIEGSMRPYVDDEEFNVLARWLRGNRINEEYDSLELGDFAPAEVMAGNCLACHSRGAAEGEGIGDRVPLEYWDDVKTLAFSKKLDPVPLSILATSTHTHALAMPLSAALLSLLFLATAWPARLKHLVVLLVFFALLADLGCWWLARWSEPFVYGIVISGSLFGALSAIQILAVLFECGRGRGRG